MAKTTRHLGSHTYANTELADFFAGLAIEGTYQLAFRDLPDIISRHVTGTSALDFGCGAGRSTRFLKSLGFNATGVDISQSMLVNARRQDAEGNYFQVGEGDLS
ncbi:MAG: methyltransferase domain-containing protein, partial [Pseudomonadota bacterium]